MWSHMGWQLSSSLAIHVLRNMHIRPFQNSGCKWMQTQGLVNVPIERHPNIGDIISNKYLKVMFKIPKMGHLPTPESCVGKTATTRPPKRPQCEWGDPSASHGPPSKCANLPFQKTWWNMEPKDKGCKLQDIVSSFKLATVQWMPALIS